MLERKAWQNKSIKRLKATMETFTSVKFLVSKQICGLSFE